jgi:hypothetical protein
MASPRRGAHRRPARHHRWLNTVLVALVLIGGGLGTVYVLRPTLASPRANGAPLSTLVDPPVRTATQSPWASPPAASVVALDVPFPSSGPGTFTYARTTGRVLGTSGPVRGFRLAIESNIDVVSMADFTAKVDATLGDPRSWTAGRTYRLQQVPSSRSYDFTVYLATSKTVERLCAPLQTNGYTSCRQGSRVVLNLDRYMTSVDGYRAAGTSLETYRTYMINHEVGHALGHDHELCPRPGAPAPVMQQQTLGLHGCTPNPWPYINGEAYDGPPADS